MARSAKPGRKAKGKKKGSVTVDMGGVESGGRTIRDGWATAKIVDAELTEAKDSGNEMFKITMEVVNGKQKAKVWDNLVLTPNALWKLKTLLEAAGVEVPDSEMDLSADDLLDLEFEVDIVNEEFEGKDRPKVASFAALGTNVDGDSDDEDDEETSRAPGSGGASHAQSLHSTSADRATPPAPPIATAAAAAAIARPTRVHIRTVRRRCCCWRHDEPRVDAGLSGVVFVDVMPP